MSHTDQRHKYWLIPLCLVMAVALCLLGRQVLNAQDPAAATTGTTGAAPAAVASSDPAITFRAAVPVGVKSANIKNWDGAITRFVSFKYKTLDKRVIKVYIPASYITQTMTRNAWDTLFKCYGMDREAEIALREEQFPNLRLSQEQMTAAMALSSVLLPEERMTGGAPTPVGGALEKMKGSTGAIWAAGEVTAPIF